MIPSRLLVLLALVPLGLAVAAVAAPWLLWPALAIDGILVAVAAVDLATTRIDLDVERHVDPVQAVGRPFEVRVRVRDRAGRPLRLRLTDDPPGKVTGLPVALVLRPGEAAEARYTVEVGTRGRHPFGPVTVRQASPLGLWERQRRLPVETELRVYPNFAALRRFGVDTELWARRAPVRARRRPGGENEFERLRPYVAGDPYRHIDWRATARRREFVTREFGQESNQNVVFLLDAGRTMTARSGALTGFDHALNAAITMGQTALRHGDRVGMLVFDREIRAWLPPRGGARTGSRLIRGTYDVFPRFEEPDYGLALRHLSRHVRRRSLVVLLTAAFDDVDASAAEALVAALRGRHLTIAVWLRDTDIDETLARPARDEADVWRRAAAADLALWRERALQKLRQRGALVVDCPPEALTPELLDRYLEIKARRLL